MKTTITLDRMHFYAHHGVLDQERRVGNDFIVSLTMEADLSAAMRSDALEDTINYAEVYTIVAEQMNQPSQLLEHVAGRIIDALRSTYPQVTGGEVSVTKVTPPFHAQLRGVTFTAKW